MFHEGLENPMVGRPVASAFALALSLALAGCAGAPEEDQGDATASGGDFPVEVASCGHTSTIDAAPEQAVTLNQGATEVMLALELEDRMVGTAYLDDQIPEKWKTAYDSIEVLSDEYPSREKLLQAEPDYVYASYGSAFEKKAVGTQEELERAGAASYLSPFGCLDEADRPEPTFDAVWEELEAVAAAFGVQERAEAFRRQQEDALEEIGEIAAGEGLDVLWYDSGDKAPLVGAGGSGPQLIMDAVGATNIFGDLEGGWAEASWEDVIDKDPDVIVLADASWSTPEDKIAQLEKDPLLKQLRAVKERRFVSVAYSEATPGIKLADGATAVSDQLVKLDLSP